MTIDRKALERALASYPKGAVDWCDEFKALYAAAEAHLATLPKTKTVYEVCATDRPSTVHDFLDTALSRAAMCVSEGRVVRLERLEIPEGKP